MGEERCILVLDHTASHPSYNLGPLGHRVLFVSQPSEVLDALGTRSPVGPTLALLLLNARLVNASPALVTRLATSQSRPNVILTGADLSMVLETAERVGAVDVVAQAANPAELQFRVKRAMASHRSKHGPNADKRARKPRKSDIIVGCSQWVQNLYERISMVANTDVTVAIAGESGTGKELVARTIHNLSARFEEPFVVVNCSAIPESLLEDELFGHVRGAFTDANRERVGLFSAAHKGTLFLDEIGTMSLALQSKLLRVLQTQEFRRLGDDQPTKVDVRLLTATNADLKAAVKRGSFREDLYYRIQVFPIQLLPLRERKEDIPLLAHHFLRLHRQKAMKGSVDGFTSTALAKLMNCEYPGNIRELENKIHHALVLASGPLIRVEDLPGAQDSKTARNNFDLSRTFKSLKGEVIENFEKSYTRQLLETHSGNLAAASRQSGMNRKNLWSLTKKYNVSLDAIRAHAKELQRNAKE